MLQIPQYIRCSDFNLNASLGMQAGGYFGVATAAVAWYIAFAELVNEVYRRVSSNTLKILCLHINGCWLVCPGICISGQLLTPACATFLLYGNSVVTAIYSKSKLAGWGQASGARTAMKTCDWKSGI